MPELPEVETLCRQLAPMIRDTVIRSLKILDPKLSAIPGLPGKTVPAVERIGKRALIRLDDGTDLALHLRMSGRLLWRTTAGALPYTRMILSFDAGYLLLVDPRRFATLTADCRQTDLCPVPNPLQEIGPGHLQTLAAERRLPVKAFLMDQRIIAGIGNIYVCEILHAAGIHPQRQAGALSQPEWKKIAGAAMRILRQAVACRGTSISDWRDLFGQPGEYQHHLRVYGRAGKACLRCAGQVERIVVGGRGTFYCPACQQ